MIIDSHQHFWIYNPQRDTWINEAMARIRKDFLPWDLHPLLRDNGVSGCIVVQADQSEEETDFLLGLAESYAFIKGVVGWVDLQGENIGERLAHYSTYEKFKGVRHIVQDEPDRNFMGGKAFQNGIGELSKYDLTYDILIHPDQLASAIALVSTFPQQRFVINHLAKPSVSKGFDSVWASHLEMLASHPNVFCKLSGLVTQVDNYSWDQDQLTPFLSFALECFGPNRLMFGSDWPVSLLAASYNQVIEMMAQFLTDLPPSEQEKIMSGNAIRFYGLKM